MTKYVYFTDHKSGHDNEDRLIPLKAKTLIEAMKEIADVRLFKNDENLRSIWLYERAGNNEYRQVMGSLDGVSFIPDNNSSTIIRNTRKSKGKTEEYFSFKMWMD